MSGTPWKARKVEVYELDFCYLYWPFCKQQNSHYQYCFFDFIWYQKWLFFQNLATTTIIKYKNTNINTKTVRSYLVLRLGYAYQCVFEWICHPSRKIERYLSTPIFFRLATLYRNFYLLYRSTVHSHQSLSSYVPPSSTSIVERK